MSESIERSLPLGRDVTYPEAYDPGLLFPIARAQSRETLRIPGLWHGADVWNAYEVSWLNAQGLPRVAMGRFIVPADSPHLIESKSLKLYLNSLNETRHDSTDAVAQLIARDLSATAGTSVQVALDDHLPGSAVQCAAPTGHCIDNLNVRIASYTPDAGLLQTLAGDEIVTERLVSHLLKSNCPVTGQPDWGSVEVQYTGRRLDAGSLLQYVVSFRRHTEFHEHCVERMYCDLWQVLQPSHLFVMARYTRRGGLDINPWRSNHPERPDLTRTARQ